eukprot:327284_1
MCSSLGSYFIKQICNHCKLLQLHKRSYHKVIQNNAVQLIKRLYANDDEINHKQCIEIINQAHKVYEKVNDNDKDQYIINTMLKLYLHFECPKYIEYIWNDIISLSRKNNVHSNVSYPLLLKCCITADNININQCIE